MGPEANNRVANYMENQFDSSVAELSSAEIDALNSEGTLVTSIDLPQNGILDRFKSFAGRKAVQIGVPATLMVASVAAACSGGSHHTEATPTFDPLNTATPNATYDAPTGTPTIENKVTPVSTNTPAPTETSTATPTPTETVKPAETLSTGKYKDLQDFLENNNSLTQGQKEAIQQQIEGSTPFIFGDDFMITISNQLIDEAGQIHSIHLLPDEVTVDSKSYTAIEGVEQMVRRGKYDAYVTKTGDTSLTFDGYLAKGDVSFPQRAWDSTDPRGFVVEGDKDAVVRSDTFIIINFEGKQDANDKQDLRPTVGDSLSYTKVGNTLKVGTFLEDTLASSFTYNGELVEPTKFTPANMMAEGLSGLSYSVASSSAMVPQILEGGALVDETLKLERYVTTETYKDGSVKNTVFEENGS